MKAFPKGSNLRWFMVLVLAGALTPFSPAHAREWPIYCRTGPALDVRVSELALNQFYTWVRFARINRPAGQRWEGLQPGQCSWPDRALHANEPTVIRFYAPQPAFTVTEAGQVRPMLSPTQCNLRRPEGYFFRVFVENKGNEFVGGKIEYPLGAGANLSAPPASCAP